MQHRTFHLVLFIGVVLGGSLAYGQGSLGAGPKKPRTLEDYKPGTLKEIVAGDAKPDGLLPFRVRVTYSASARPISNSSNNALHLWAQCCAGNPDHYTKGYLREMLFVENGAAYWLPVQDSLVADFQTQLKAGEVLDLFLIRISAPETNGKRGSVLLVERFQRAETNSDQVKASLDWIRSNLASYTGRDLKVEILEPCQLSITDSSNSAGVSKAVVWIPLIDLDPSKVSVDPQHGSDMWALWLHTTSGKNSIRFMLYQGGPAEGGETNKYSLTIPVKEKAEAMAEAFRRAINLCAAAKTQPGSGGSVAGAQGQRMRPNINPIHASRLNQGNLIGLLGRPLGEVITIEGIAADENYTGRKADLGQILLRVQTVNGKALKSETIFPFVPYEGTQVKRPSAVMRFKYIGYETGGFSGIPEAAFAYVPRAPTSGYYFTTSFVILRDNSGIK